MSAATQSPVGNSSGNPCPKKRLVICCDGTWQSANQGRRSNPSNIAKLSRAISQYFIEDEKAGVQICYYDAGVGTGLPGGLAGSIYKNYTGYYGVGLNENICEAYNFLVNNYSTGDEIFFFGFSRGAYTARATAGLIASVGLCNNGGMKQFWEMYAAWTTRGNLKIGETEWGKAFAGAPENVNLEINGQKLSIPKGNGSKWLADCFHPIIKVVGVFETVGGLGYPENYHAELNMPHGFHDTSVSKEIQYAFHALCLDERRTSYTPTMWSLEDDNKVTWLEQVWFTGAHVNVGGGSDDGLKPPTLQKGDLESRANISFAWMVDRVKSFLRFDESVLQDMSQDYVKSLDSLFLRLKPAEPTPLIWGAGPIIDISASQLPIISSAPTTRTPGEYYSPRKTKEYIHPSVYHAIENSNYRPPALRSWTRVATKDLPKSTEQGIDSRREKSGYTWVKTMSEVPESKIQGYLRYLTGGSVPMKELEERLEIPEFAIPQSKDVGGGNWNGNGEFNMERIIVQATANVEVRNGKDKAKNQIAVEYLEKLDRENF